MNNNTMDMRLVETVQHNCHLSDAHYARDYSLCIYLLKMREFYRWEHGIPFGETLPKNELGEWLTAREKHWESIQDSDFIELTYQEKNYLPFESDSVNLHLIENAMVYSGGYCGAKPHFFIAELESVRKEHGANIYISGHELARELVAPPAMTLGNNIFIRRESLQRMIWEKLEEWGWQDPERAIARAAAHYNYQHDLQGALDDMTSDELDTLLQHELGELELGIELGKEWEQMLAALPRSKAEFQLRAIRDHLVDCRFTLPWLLGRQRDAALHFYFANFTTMRKAIFPSLTLAYQAWLDGDKGAAIREATNKGSEQWQSDMDEALAIFRQLGEDSKELMKRLNQMEVQH